MSIKLSRFPVDPEATAVAIAYRNPDFVLIADAVMPRCTPVSQTEFSYLFYPVATLFTVPDDTMSSRGKANQITTGADKLTAKTEDHGLKDVLSAEDIDDAKKNKVNAVNLSIEHAMYFVTLNREIRVANIVGNANNYGGNSTALAGADMWSDDASKPLDALLAALDEPLMRPNTMTISQLGWTRVRTHPNVITAIKPTGSDGAVTKQQVIEYLEIDEILIGAGRVNAAKMGQPVDLQPCWGNWCALHFRSKQANTKGGITWGMTVPKGNRVAGSWPEKEVGLTGGVVTLAGESVAEVVVAPEAGFLFENIM